MKTALKRQSILYSPWAPSNKKDGDPFYFLLQMIWNNFKDSTLQSFKFKCLYWSLMNSIFCSLFLFGSWSLRPNVHFVKSQLKLGIVWAFSWICSSTNTLWKQNLLGLTYVLSLSVSVCHFAYCLRGGVGPRGGARLGHVPPSGCAVRQPFNIMRNDFSLRYSSCSQSSFLTAPVKLPKETGLYLTAWRGEQL